MNKTKDKTNLLSSADIPLAFFASCSEPVIENKKTVSFLVLVDHNSDSHVNFNANRKPQ